MNPQISRLAKRSKTAIIAYKIYNNWRTRRRSARGMMETVYGATHSRKPLADSLNYINVQFADYLRYAGLTPAKLAGKRVFELGFGDNVGVALRFLAAGAARAVCLDRFYSKRDVEQERRIYRALRDTLGEEEKQRFDDAIDLRQEIKFNPARLKCIYGASVEQTPELPESEPFDLVISRAAIEEIYDPDVTFVAMDRLLASGGQMLHKIDLSDYGMFREQGMNPLTFLTIPESIYRLMAVDAGVPNRKLMGYYRRKMVELGYDAKLLIASVIGRNGRNELYPHKEKICQGLDYSESVLESIRQIRPALIPSYRNLPDEELIVDGIFLVARKP